MAFAINGVHGAQQEAERRYNAADCDASSPCRVARAAGGVIATVGLGGAAIRGGFALAQYCFANPLVCNTLGIEVASLVGVGGLPAGTGAPVLSAATKAVANEMKAGSGVGKTAAKVQRRIEGNSGTPIVLENGFYSVDGIKISKSYYDRLWSQGRPAPFLQVKEILKSNPKITPDPLGAPGYFRYEGAGLDMIYNPSTGQVGHIQPTKIK